MDVSPKVSIIVRTKNEEKWITSCLSSIFRQEYTDFEVILVDNCSTDRTLEKALSYPIDQTLTIDKFLPGNALNLGVKASSGKFIVCISAHCIPVDAKWLGNLIRNFDDERIAGVYGRQEPMAFTSEVDKRDLINIFGLDRKVQVKDSFFHNANSMIRRDIWEKFPFSETTTNIEDRIWAKEILEKGYRLVYEPEASVYHYHGINQGRNIERARNVVRILEELHGYKGGKFDINDINVITIIPARKPVKYVGSTSLLELAIQSVIKSNYLSQIVVAVDNKEHFDIASRFGVKIIERPPEYSHDYVELSKVYQYVLDQLTLDGINPDLVALVHEVFPFRSLDLIDSMVEQLVNSDRDSVMAVTPVFRSLWKEQENNLVRIDQGFMPSKFKDPLYMGLYGLGCLLESNLIRQGKKLGYQTGLVIVNNPYSSITASTKDDLEIVEALLPQWYEYLKSVNS